ncbi:MAG: cytochrome c peroxidase [Myxococcota bacterium]
MRRLRVSARLGCVAALLLASGLAACSRQPAPAPASPSAPPPATVASRAAAEAPARDLPRLETDKPTRGGLYRVQIHSQTLPVPLRRPHRWVARITTADGRPALVDQIEVGGGMPAHGHGFPATPRVEDGAGPGPGDHVIAGVEFNMEGRWELSLAIAGPAGLDEVSFTLDLRDAAGGERPAGEADLQLLASLALTALPAAPADPTNRVADDPRAVALGAALFADPGLSGGAGIACTTCHQPGRHLTDGMDRAHGTGVAERNTPTLLGVGHARWLTWDGRRDSLWAQALAPLESAAEMGSTRLAAVRYVVEHPAHGPAFAALFGAPDPALAAPDSPARAGPFGDAEARAAWARLPPATQAAVDGAFASIGKVLAAFQRTLLPGPARFDRYVAARLAGDPAAASVLSDDERAGLALFTDPARTHCLRCHNGPLLSNGGFHNVGTGSLEPPTYDLGRSVGIQAVLIDPFNCAGPHSDAGAGACRHLDQLGPGHHAGSLRGAFKAPTLRNVAETGPYMHDGRFASLEAVVDHYRELPPGQSQRHELPEMALSERESAQLVAFLKTLTSEPRPSASD